MNFYLRLLKGTSFGPVGLVWHEGQDGRPRLWEVVTSCPRENVEARMTAAFPGLRNASCPDIEELADGIAALLRGQAASFSLATLALERCPSFQQAALRALSRVKRGEVTTYGRLAAAIGRERAARAVGHAMATNPFPLIVPCHRVIRADGRLGEYGGGAGMKRALLALEGVRVDDAGRVLP